MNWKEWAFSLFVIAGVLAVLTISFMAVVKAAREAEREKQAAREAGIRSIAEFEAIRTRETMILESLERIEKVVVGREK